MGQEARQDVAFGPAQGLVVVATNADGGCEVAEGREAVGVVGVDDQLFEG